MNEKEPTRPESASPIARQTVENSSQAIFFAIASFLSSFFDNPRNKEVPRFEYIKQHIGQMFLEAREREPLSFEEKILFDDMRNKFFEILESPNPPKKK